MRGPDGQTVIDHNSAETYRYNGEVVRQVYELFGLNLGEEHVP
ncbi:MAG: hypothetical protein Q8S13_07895 [Dehalococcoidia bacterium]|nr:hypothetical protein [Dehalococcoidia bacterium]